MRARWSLAAGLVVLVAIASGCGDSGYQYVQNDDLGVYARLPDDWAVYDETDLFPDDSDREIEGRMRTSWVRTFDAAGEPSVEHSQQVGSEPTGHVQILALPPEQRDMLNLSVLRGGLNPSLDPVALEAAGPSEGGSQVAVLVDEPVEFDGNFSGVHTVFAMQTDADGTIVVDRTAVRNAETTAVALFEVRCSETCYFETHKDEIADLVDSWTIQEVR